MYIFMIIAIFIFIMISVLILLAATRMSGILSREEEAKIEYGKFGNTCKYQ